MRCLGDGRAVPGRHLVQRTRTGVRLGRRVDLCCGKFKARLVESSQPDTAEPKRSLGRSVVRIGGTILALVAIAYVGRAIVQNEIWASGSTTLSQILAIAVVGGGVYAAISIFYRRDGGKIWSSKIWKLRSGIPTAYTADRKSLNTFPATCSITAAAMY